MSTTSPNPLLDNALANVPKNFRAKLLTSYLDLKKNCLDGIDTDAVIVENRPGAEEAVHHLIEHGHSSIACIGNNHDAYTIHERLQGYINSMLASGLKPLVSPRLRQLTPCNPG